MYTEQHSVIDQCFVIIFIFHRLPNAVGVAMTLNPNGVGVKAEPVMSTGVGGVGGPRKQSATKT